MCRVPNLQYRTFAFSGWAALASQRRSLFRIPDAREPEGACALGGQIGRGTSGISIYLNRPISSLCRAAFFGQLLVPHPLTGHGTDSLTLPQDLAAKLVEVVSQRLKAVPLAQVLFGRILPSYI
jgi:hypothetical protein